ncbi:valine--tRNA ligase [Patescibacteria group bacterium]|jgi:valyl-tRNA synthetase|nr:valine--tRNA ligase [Patescibacteria group bacterium]
MDEKFLKPYDPNQYEAATYQKWEASGYFNPDRCVADGITKEDAEPYCIIMPPPNANGSLHAGHALFVTLQDIMTRHARMQGKRALWFPGADHAGFETQVVYEKKLAKEGRSRFQMDPRELYDEIMAFTLENKQFMEGQLRQLGASCDWSRQLFTLDERVVATVYDTFKKLEEDNLLYRGARIVNWCPKHQTSLSNLETIHEERTDTFYYLKYGPFTIGTARPETKFGDKYVVMHPEDERYRDYEHGQKIEVEWITGPITATVIKDEASDPEMGSGVMTITPWHSGVDFEIAKRHNLDYEQIIDWRGKLLPIAGEFAGMDIREAREKIVEKLNEKGLLVKVDTAYQHTVPVCYKCEREIEPQIKSQWFVHTKPLAERALAALDAGDFRILTEKDEKVFRHWMGSIDDWNISRQVVWGIPIPAKICTDCGAGMVDLDDTVTTCRACGGAVEPDPDTFDTWFSSGQWPFVTLGYPDSPDFATYYPTTVMETAADILFFWVARMVMLGLYRTGEIPFRDVYLHGIVRDKHGKKMSKSKGNVIAPTDVSEKYGTDALRMGLIVGNTPGTGLNLDPDKINAYKKFANKVWNITRFVLTETEGVAYEPNFTAWSMRDQELIERRHAFVADITKDCSTYRFYLAAEKLYHYLWDEFAAEILEESKQILAAGSEEERASRQQFLITTLDICLRALHPFMPYVTEEIWAAWPHKRRELLMVETWPTA